MPDNDVGGEAEVLGGADDFGASDVIGYLLGLSPTVAVVTPGI